MNCYFCNKKCNTVTLYKLTCCNSRQSFTYSNGTVILDYFTIPVQNGFVRVFYDEKPNKLFSIYFNYKDSRGFESEFYKFKVHNLNINPDSSQKIWNKYWKLRSIS